VRRRAAALFKSGTVAIPGRWFGASATDMLAVATGNGGLCMHTICARNGCTSASRRRPLPERGWRRDVRGPAKGRRRRFLRSPSSSLASACTKCASSGRTRPASTCKTMVLSDHPASASCAATTTAHLAIHQQGMPSDFGFPIVVHPHDRRTIYVVPLDPATRPVGQRAGRGGARRRCLVAEARRGLRKRRATYGAARRSGPSTSYYVRPRSTSGRPPDSSDRPRRRGEVGALSTRSRPIHCGKG